MDFVTLGMFIIGRFIPLKVEYGFKPYDLAPTDEIYYPLPRKPEIGIPGGAGSYAIVGARLFRAPPSSGLVGWAVHAGSDFPIEIEKEISSWNTTMSLIRTPNRLTTRGRNRYTNEHHRGRYFQQKRKALYELTSESSQTSSISLPRSGSTTIHYRISTYNQRPTT